MAMATTMTVVTKTRLATLLLLCLFKADAFQIIRTSTYYANNHHNSISSSSSSSSSSSLLSQLHSTKSLATDTPSSSSSLVPAVSIVSVCTAELCCCQEEGGNALEILENLNSRSLPYPIEEAPCLGACGGGAMVAIDFEDGSAALVSGLKETLAELGLDDLEEEEEENSMEREIETINMVSTGKSTTNGVNEQDLVSPVSFKNNIADVVEPTSSDKNDIIVDSAALSNSNQKTTPVNTQMNDSPIATATTTAASVQPNTTNSKVAEVPNTTKPSSSTSTPTTTTVTAKSSSSSSSSQYQMTSDDVRERMRAEAAKDADERVNPWLNMASYLAGKARDKILGSSQDS